MQVFFGSGVTFQGDSGYDRKIAPVDKKSGLCFMERKLAA
jgi:hypothetical protein